MQTKTFIQIPSILFYLSITFFCFLMPSIVCAQKANNYEKDWSAISKLENDRLTKSALDSVQNLYNRISKDVSNPAQTAQTIKALLFINKYQARLEEDGLVKAIARFEQEVEKAKFPTKAILQSMVAEMYHRYLQNQYYKFSNRTATTDFEQDDIRTWDISKITNKTYELYLASVQYPESQKINIKEFDALIRSGSNTEGLRPTLYDFLIHRALDFFRSDQYYLTKPAYQFYLESEADFGDVKDFINQKLVVRDSLASEFHILKLFQQALKFHLNDENKNALIDLNLKRLSFVKGKSILINKDALYLKRLEALKETYKDNPASTEITYEIAMHYYNLGQKYRPSPTEEHRWELKKAYELCQKAKEAFPKSFGATKCASLMTLIETKSLSLTIEKVKSIDAPSLGLLSHKNLDKIYFKVVAITSEEYNDFNSKYGKAKVAFLNKLSGAYKWNIKLTNEGDYQAHNTEFALPSLKNGRYIIVASANEEFSYTENGLAYSHFFISDIAFLNRKEKGVYEFFMTDRTSGKVLEGVKAEFFVSKYNSLLRRYETVKIHTAKSDKDGYLESKYFAGNNSYSRNSFKVKFTYGKDVLYLDDTYYNSKAPVYYPHKHTHFFLDRAIYRPGQTIHFKGIVLSQMTDGKDPVIITNQKIPVEFYDANSQSIEKIVVRTNEYGTFHGSFVAPSSGMMGQMAIRSHRYRGHAYIRVEEYKRPKFELSPQPITSSYKIDDTVTVTGLAKAYAGSNIDGAKVQYRVYRQARFPYWNWRWGWYNPYNQVKQEIAFGETITDEKGEYKIQFKAIADKSIPKDKNPEFYYTVEATVTDITGETHSSNSSLRVGYIALDINVNVPETIERNSAKPINISSKNLNGEFEAAQGKITVQLLKTPRSIFIKRYWETPEYNSLAKDAFHKKFPHYPFQNEDKVENWKVLKTVISKSFDTEKTKELNLDKINKWKQGKYKLTLTTKDKYGVDIEVIKFFTVYNSQDKKVPLNEAIFLAKTNFYNVEPDTTIKLDIGTFNKEAFVLYEIEHDKEIVHREWIQVKGRTKLPIKVEEKHRGNLHFHLSTIENGRSYLLEGSIYVPWSNKDLKIEYTTFRDKLYPGQEEEWRIKVTGNKGEKVMAEFLAGMYDASLDAFAPNNWNFNIHPTSSRQLGMYSRQNFSKKTSSFLHNDWNKRTYPSSRTYHQLNWFGFSFYEYQYTNYRGKNNRVSRASGGALLDDVVYDSPAPEPEAEPIESIDEEKSLVKRKESSSNLLNTNGKTTAIHDLQPDIKFEGGQGGETAPEEDFGEVQVRTNLNETVFFYPDLMCDEEGNLIIKFTMNEALTKWKFMLLGHTKELASIVDTREVVTQKDLMVMPNPPRFFRENDEIHFTAKVSNLTEDVMKGNAKLMLFDAISMKPIDAAFGNTSSSLAFEAKGRQSAPLSWKLNIPDGWNTPIVHRVVAKSGDFSDGEESALPVLTNRMMVTETQPLPIRGKTSKDFEFKRMTEASKSTTLKHHKLTLEFTQNPAWYAIQALPYLMEYPYECTEQIFSRYYANSLASNVANSHPKVKRVFDQWKNIDSEALKSNLSKNEELKYALLEETPWVMQAQSEETQKKNIGLLFDLNKMANELTKAKNKMAERQLANGGFSWMPGGRDSWYITQYIVEGMGHMDKLGVTEIKKDKKMSTMLNKAVDYIDVELARHYTDLLKWAKRSKDEKAYLERDHLSQMVIHYFYARTFFLDQEINNETTLKAIEYFEGQIVNYWKDKSMYMQGLLALGLHRKEINPDKNKALSEIPNKIVAAAKENALNSDEMGMYWKYPSGYYWYQLPIETHALMIEVFDVVAKDKEAVEDLKVWLLKAKQTTHWKTTKATAAACYSLLMTGNNWLLDDKEIEISLGGQKLDQSKIKKEAGTGYFKTTWEANEIKPEMSNISVKNPNDVVAWGALYWQYFENLDKITHFKETPLKLNKKLFKQINTAKGPVLTPIEKEKLEPGDLIKVRIELMVDRDMEYVHMKDMRAAGLEPVNVLSQYKYQGGLGYYESTRDAATNFFFSYLSKGTYVFEYPLRVNHKGDFSNGITTIQCMYAPEFTAHSEGIRLTVE